MAIENKNVVASDMSRTCLWLDMEQKINTDCLLAFNIDIIHIKLHHRKHQNV